MTAKRQFQCEQCNGKTEVNAGDAAPDCCGKPMNEVKEQLDQCTASSTAEHSRFDDMGEPCDDGRSG